MATVKGFVFDDEPIESLLYDEPSTGPTPASIFAAAEAVVTEIAEAFNREDGDTALRRMRDLLGRGQALSVPDLVRCTKMLQPLVPLVPCPIVPETAVSCDTLLEPILAAFLERDLADLSDGAGTLLFRWYEGAGRYDDAARVVMRLLEHAKRGSNRSYEAVLINNLAYEYYLGGDWVRGEEWFTRAIELFAACGDAFELANARANLLLCRFATAGGRPFEGLEQELNEILPAVGKDWRRRKPLIMLARIAEARGDLEAAIEFARQAVEASDGVPTRHHAEDVLYMERLESLRGNSRETGFRASEDPGKA